MATPAGTAQPNPLPDKYDQNAQSLTFTKTKNVLQYGFGVVTQFTGNILYVPESASAESLYGGAEINRGNKNSNQWDNGAWPATPQSFEVNNSPGNTGAQYLVAGNPSCGVQKECTFTKGTSTAVNAVSPTTPNLSINKCCVPYYDKAALLKPGNDYIFNSYYGSCYSGYNWYYDFCGNKQIWIQAKVKEVSSATFGTYGVPDIASSYLLNLDSNNKPTSLIQNSRNTKDRVFFGGKGNQGGNAANWGCNLNPGPHTGGGVWCGLNLAGAYKGQNFKAAPINLPQKSLNNNWQNQ